jgi:acyl carrier protein phosphodiesterase
VNWLAHVFLSDDNIEQRLGNLLADLVRGEAREEMSVDFRAGALRHRAIDAYTDAHPVVRRSRARVATRHRRFSGVLVDVFYDYLLASRWDLYSDVSLAAFTTTFYAQASASRIALPPDARATVDRIIEHDLLGAYRRLEGVEQSLRRLSIGLARRWRRDFALDRAVEDLRAHEHAFFADFEEFFPQLQAHLEGHVLSGPS